MIKDKERGASLVESLLVIVIISSIVFLLSNLLNALGLINKSKHLSLAREIAVKQLEDKRTIKYKDLTDGNSFINDSRLSLLPQGTGTITIEDCDPNVCTSGEQNIKQVSVLINWKDNSKTHNLTLKTLISKVGLSK